MFLSVTGGLSPRQQNLATLFETHGWAVQIIAWDRGGGRAAAWSESRWPVTHITVPGPVSSLGLLRVLPRYLWALRRELRARKRDDDGERSVVIATHPFHLIWARACGGRWIYDAGEFFAVDLARYFGPLATVGRALISQMELRLSRRAAAVLCVDSRGGWLRRRFERAGLPVHVIWNLPALGDDPESNAVTLTRAQRSDRPVIAYVGGMERHKGLDVTLRALSIVIREYPDAVLLLIGPAPDSGERLRHLISSSNLERNVRWLGPMGYRQLLVNLRGADVGLHLAHGSPIFALVGPGNGRKTFTYMQAGLAIVGSNEGKILDAARAAGCAETVDPTDDEAIARALRDLLRDKKKLTAYQKRSRAAFEELWSWERIAPEVWEFLVTNALSAPSTEIGALHEDRG